MTEQQGPPAQEPTAADQAPPPPAAPPQGGAGWQSASAPPPAPVAGAPGFVYADVPNRAVAYIIDAIILFVINLIIGLIVGTFLPSARLNPNATDIFNVVEVNYAAVLVTTLIGLAINAVYFIYTWTQMRGSPGQRMLGMQLGNAADGATVTQEQAIRRWIFLGAPFGLASALNPIPALGLLLALASLAYFIYLLVSTAQSPTKQGFHDKQANTVVVKAARSVS
jgi:uncharacterized RDD family membrane protein YckC